MAQRSVPLDQVEDVVQETWLSVLGSVSRFEGRSSLPVWIVGILKRRIADSYRRARPEHVLRESALACDGMLALERTAQAQLVRWIEGALLELSELERAAVRLCDFQGVERAEAASLLGITPGHLRVSLHRAHHKLADELRRRESRPAGNGPGPRSTARARSRGQDGARLDAPALRRQAQPLRAAV
jgi:RNA polymerase sigma factor (sigma-70 family)